MSQNSRNRERWRLKARDGCGMRVPSKHTLKVISRPCFTSHFCCYAYQCQLCLETPKNMSNCLSALGTLLSPRVILSNQIQPFWSKRICWRIYNVRIPPPNLPCEPNSQSTPAHLNRDTQLLGFGSRWCDVHCVTHKCCSYSISPALLKHLVSAFTSKAGHQTKQDRSLDFRGQICTICYIILCYIILY